jgi:hypothetical protein
LGIKKGKGFFILMNLRRIQKGICDGFKRNSRGFEMRSDWNSREFEKNTKENLK